MNRKSKTGKFDSLKVRIFGKLVILRVNIYEKFEVKKMKTD